MIFWDFFPKDDLSVFLDQNMTSGIILCFASYHLYHAEIGRYAAFNVAFSCPGALGEPRGQKTCALGKEKPFKLIPLQT